MTMWQEKWFQLNVTEKGKDNKRRSNKNTIYVHVKIP